MCELLAIEPIEGKLLSSIIHKLEGESEEIIASGNDGDNNKRGVMWNG